MGAHLKPAAVAAATHLKGYEPLVGPQHAVHLVEAVGRRRAGLVLLAQQQVLVPPPHLAARPALVEVVDRVAVARRRLARIRGQQLGQRLCAQGGRGWARHAQAQAHWPIGRGRAGARVRGRMGARARGRAGARVRVPWARAAVYVPRARACGSLGYGAGPVGRLRARLGPLEAAV